MSQLAFACLWLLLARGGDAACCTVAPTARLIIGRIVKLLSPKVSILILDLLKGFWFRFSQPLSCLAYCMSHSTKDYRESRFRLAMIHNIFIVQKHRISKEGYLLVSGVCFVDPVIVLSLLLHKATAEWALVPNPIHQSYDRFALLNLGVGDQIRSNVVVNQLSKVSISICKNREEEKAKVNHRPL